MVDDDYGDHYHYSVALVFFYYVLFCVDYSSQSLNWKGRTFFLYCQGSVFGAKIGIFPVIFWARQSSSKPVESDYEK